MHQSFQHDSKETDLDLEADICDSPQIDPFEELCGDIPTSSPLDIARRYIARGWAPVPIPFREKGPNLNNWGLLRLDSQTALQHFNCGSQNIGVILGAASGGLVDIDLDCPEAGALAPAFLPPTGAIFGREGNPASHWLYRAPGMLTQQVKMSGTTKTLLELRSNTNTEQPSQTVFPGSVHKSGEPIEWVGSSQEPANVSPDKLAECFRRLAAATIIARAFPDAGAGRHNATLALIGFLTRAGWEEDRVVATALAIRTAINADSKKPLRKMAKDAAERLQADKLLYGLPALIEAFGDKAVAQICELLGYEPAAHPQICAQAKFDEEPLPETSADDGLRLIDPASWHGVDVPERDWALQGWIPQGQATYLTGPGSAGKPPATDSCSYPLHRVSLTAFITATAHHRRGSSPLHPRCG